MQNCKHKTVQDGKTSSFSVFRASCEFAPSQLARLRCSNTLAYRFSSERETARSLRESVKKGASASTTTAANEFAYFQTFSRLLNSLKMSCVDEFPLEFISWGPHLSWERARKKNSSSLVNREIRHFHVIVVQWRNGNVPKSVMHVHACASAIKEQKKCWEFLAQKFDRFQTLRSKPQTTRKRTQHVPSNNVASFCTGRKTFVLRPRP